MFYGGLAGVAGFAASTYMYTDEQVRQAAEAARMESEAEGGSVLTAVKAYCLRQFDDARHFYTKTKTGFTDPPSDQLLDDPSALAVHYNLRTLVLDLDEVLVHSHWDRSVGWRTLKRPGASDLIETLLPYYELVVWTNRNYSYADPILNRVDPGLVRNEGHMITARLYKNSCQWKNNESMRDLSKLNRDLSKVIFVTTESRKHTVEPSDNVIVIPDWDDMDPNDTTLLDIIPLLELVVRRDVPDTREICRSYEGKDIVREFRARIAAPPEARPPARRGRFLFG